MPTKAEIQAQAEKKLAERARARTDYLFLGNDVLGMDFQPDVHAELFEALPDFQPDTTWADQFGRWQKRLILWPRGHYKTSAIVVAVIRAIICYPDVRILLMQGSLKVTKTLMHAVRSHFDGTAARSRFQELFPEFCGSKSELGASQLGFTTPARTRKQIPQATVTCASPRSLKTGQHFDWLVADDVIHEGNYRSIPQLQKAKEDFFMAMPLIDPPFSVTVTGTRYAFEPELYAVILRAESDKPKDLKEWRISVKDCWSDDRKEVRFPQRTTKDGRIIGFTREGLLAIQANDPAMFAGQYLNQPITASSNLFTDEKMMASVIAEQDAPALTQAILFVDLASTTEYYSDDSCILAMKTDHIGRMYVVDGRGDQWTPAALAIHLIDMAIKHRPLRILFEKTPSCTYFVEYLRVVCRDKGIQLPIDFIKIDTQADAKNVRVCSTEGYIRTKRLLFFAGLAIWDKLVSQLKRFPKAKNGHDDYADTLALGVRFLTGEVTPTIPLSDKKNSFLAAIELHEAQQQAQSLLLQEQQPAHYDGCGADFD
jgi:predicted phage terminase large subunit-like protein